MAQRTMSEQRASVLVKPQSKVCPRCSQKKPLEDFYVNKKWEEQSGRDKWCKECFAQITTKDMLRQYFWENRRVWSDDLWNKAVEAAEEKLKNVAVYIKAPEARKKPMLEKTAIQIVPSLIGRYYRFIEGDDKNRSSYADAIINGELEIPDEEDPNERTYSEFFNGNFTKRELEYLNTYYKKLEEDFTFTDENIRDYAKKLAKQSLIADKAQDDFNNGRCAFDVVKDAIAEFDRLSKSGNFAACRKDKNAKRGLTSWAETTMFLETNGYCKKNYVRLELDDIDKCILNLRHTVEAIGLDENSG